MQTTACARTAAQNCSRRSKRAARLTSIRNSVLWRFQRRDVKRSHMLRRDLSLAIILTPWRWCRRRHGRWSAASIMSATGGRTMTFGRVWPKTASPANGSISSLAEYRVHPRSMMKTQTHRNYRDLILNYTARHPWTSLVDREPFRAARFSAATLTEPSAREHDRQDPADPPCPVSKQKFGLWFRIESPLVSVDGLEMADRRRPRRSYRAICPRRRSRTPSISAMRCRKRLSPSFAKRRALFLISVLAGQGKIRSCRRGRIRDLPQHMDVVGDAMFSRSTMNVSTPSS